MRMIVRATVAVIILSDHSTADVTVDLMVQKMATIEQVGLMYMYVLYCELRLKFTSLLNNFCPLMQRIFLRKDQIIMN